VDEEICCLLQTIWSCCSYIVDASILARAVGAGTDNQANAVIINTILEVDGVAAGFIQAA